MPNRPASPKRKKIIKRVIKKETTPTPLEGTESQPPPKKKKVIKKKIVKSKKPAAAPLKAQEVEEILPATVPPMLLSHQLTLIEHDSTSKP